MQRALLAAAVCGAIGATFGASDAQAQFSFGNRNFGITIGPSYGVYPYGYGYGRGYGYGAWGPTYGVYPAPTYAYPYRSGGTYVRRSAPTPPPAPPREGAGLPIKIVSPDDAGVALSYSLNEFPYTIEPGQSQSLVNDRQWIITFDRGGEYGTARYALEPGTYEFALSDRGWEIYHDADVSKLTSPEGKNSPARNPLPEPKSP